MLDIRGLTKRYKNFFALDHFDLHVDRGELFGFVGPNGAGKTTTMKILAGLLKPDAGTVVMEGHNVLKDRAYVRESVGYMPDYAGIYDNMKVFEYMEFYASTYRIQGLQARERYQELLEMVGLSEKSSSYVEELSRGMKQRLSLARALIHDPKLLILDEPASGLDPQSRYHLKEVLKYLSREGKTIIISSHILSELSEMCTDIGIIDKGKMILRGSLIDIMDQVNQNNPLEITIYEGMEEAARILREHPKVQTITFNYHKIVVSFSGSHEEEARLLKKLVMNDVLVYEFIRRTGSLENLFMQITEGKEEMTIQSFREKEEGYSQC